MTIQHRTKLSRQRGHKTHGWGSKKKHRGGGSRGGRGYSGFHKHKFSFVVTKEPDHFGYKGFFGLNKKERTINIDQLAVLSEEKTINLREHGYDKLLGKGTVEKQFIVIVSAWSKRAKEKIEQAGGTVQNRTP